MSTALHEPPQGIRVGRLVKVAGKPRSAKRPPRPEPRAPQAVEVRLLVFLGLGGAAYLVALAVAGLLLVAEESGVAEAEAAPALGPVAAAIVVPERPETLPQRMAA